MSKTITFKPEFEKKLKELKIKTKFVKNFTSKEHGHTKLSEWEQELFRNTDNWHDFIIYSFVWRNTSEGKFFWSSQSYK